MREIKLRAYIKSLRIMVDVQRINFDIRTIECYIIDREEGDMSEYSFDEIELIQSTGLLDKNQKEIYEGDIVSFNDGGEEGYEYKEGFEFTNIAVVVFEDGRFTLSEFASDNSYILENSDEQSEILEALNNGEIIGNIYENPELLPYIKQ